MMRSRGSSRLGPAVLAAVAVVLLSSCGGSSTPASTAAATGSGSASASSPSETAAGGCADVAALKSSLQALTAIKPLQDGTAALKSAVADTKTALDAAATSVSAELKPAVDQVKTQFAAVQTAADGTTAGNLRQKVPQIVSALQGLGTATASLGTTLQQRCRGS
jgi:hypothetical protein